MHLGHICLLAATNDNSKSSYNVSVQCKSRYMGVFKRQLERKIQHYQSSFEQEYFAYSFVIANSLKVPQSLVIRGKFTQKHLPA